MCTQYTYHTPFNQPLLTIRSDIKESERDLSRETKVSAAYNNSIKDDNRYI